MHRNASTIAAGLCVAISLVATADVRITEYMYSGADGEFIELTNVGTAPIDLTGWSFDDSNAVAGTFDISSIGILAPGASAIITERPAHVFRAQWSLPASLAIVGGLAQGNGNNIGRNDAINLYDAQGTVVDSLVYGDQDFPGSIRTQNVAGWTNAAGLGQNNPYAWVLATVGDAQASVATAGGLGSPGSFTLVDGPAPRGGMFITEYMYQGPGGEFIEFTNLSDAPIDMTGWSFDDNNFGGGATGPFDLSGFGIVQPGESVILTESASEAFRTSWNLGPAVKIVGDLGKPNGNGLARNDAINIYDATGTVVDTLAYGDQTFPGSIRTQNISGWTVVADLGTNNPYAWVLSSVGDAQSSFVSAGGDIGSPGTYPLPPTLGDLDGNGAVDAADLAILLGAWGSCPPKGGCPADLDGDGSVGAADLAILLGAWS